MTRSGVRYWARTAALLAIATGLAGCEYYIDRRDRVSLGAGDAIAANKATQTINRWPRAAYDDRWLSSGDRAQRAIHRYKTDTIKDPKALGEKQVEAAPENVEGPTTGKETK